MADQVGGLVVTGGPVQVGGEARGRSGGRAKAGATSGSPAPPPRAALRLEFWGMATSTSMLKSPPVDQRGSAAGPGGAAGRLAPVRVLLLWVRAAASTRWPGPCPPTRTSPTCMRRQATRASPSSPTSTRWTRRTPGRWLAWPGLLVPTWSWSARRRHWSPASAARGRHPAPRPGHPLVAAIQGLEVVRQHDAGGPGPHGQGLRAKYRWPGAGERRARPRSGRRRAGRVGGDGLAGRAWSSPPTWLPPGPTRRPAARRLPAPAATVGFECSGAT